MSALEFHAAIRDGNVDLVKRFAAEAADLNDPIGGDLRPLDIASGRGKTRICNVLIDAGADISDRGRPGLPVLHHAVANAKVSVAKLLLKCGADIEEQNTIHGTTLQVAIYHGLPRLVETLITAGADVNNPGRSRITPLHQAATRDGKKHTKIVKLLLDAGADARFSDDCIVVAASGSSNVDVINLLIHAGADIEASNSHGETPLMLAAFAGKIEIVRLLLEAGANRQVTAPKAHRHWSQLTAYEIARSERKTKVAKLLELK